MKTAKITATLAALTFALTASSFASAQSHGHEHHAPAAAGQAAAMSSGEIKKVDKDTSRVTIKHGPLENLSMPGMTMVFGVKDAAMLEGLKGGDKIQFIAEQLQGRYVVTKLAVQN